MTAEGSTVTVTMVAVHSVLPSCFVQMKGSVCIAQSSVQVKVFIALITLSSGPPCPSLDWASMAVYFLRIH